MSNLHSTKNNYVAKVYSHGKINLPMNVKDDLSIHDGDQVIFIKHGNSWTLTTRNAWIKDAQSYARSLNPNNESMVDNLIEERRESAEHEVM